MAPHDSAGIARETTRRSGSALLAFRRRIGMGLFSQLFDLSPFPAVVSRCSTTRCSRSTPARPRSSASRRARPSGCRVTDYYVDPAERRTLAERIRRDGRADNVRLRIKRRSGEPFWVLVSFRLVTWQGRARRAHDLPGHHRAARGRVHAQGERAPAGRAERCADVPDGAIHRSGATSSPNGCAASCRSRLRRWPVERLSMWRFDDERPAIQCVGLYQRASGRYQIRSDGAAPRRPRLLRRARARARRRRQRRRDRSAHPRVRRALSDSPQHRSDARRSAPAPQHAVGVLCAEHVGRRESGRSTSRTSRSRSPISSSWRFVDDERRQALTRLAESEARARLIVDTAHDAFIGIDSAGGIAAWNAQAERPSAGRTTKCSAAILPRRSSRRPFATRTRTACGASTKPVRRRWSTSASS